MNEYKNKVALVTGSSKGIGAATIIEFAKKGCNVVINYNNSQQESNDLKEKIENKYNVKALAIKADVSNEKEVKLLVSKIINEFGTIDYLVNNAGIAIDSTLDDKTVENFRKIIDINLIGTFLVTKYVGKIMLENKFGRIVNVSSTNGIDTYYPYSLDYDASKAGIISLTHNFAIEFSPYINVNSIAPGWVNTDMNKELDPQYIKEEEEKILLQRFAQPEEIAKTIVFLCGPESSYINNAIIRVDGGIGC